MHRLFALLHVRFARRALAATTFCDECGEVCTPTCRQEALREQTYLKTQESILYRR